jgi:uncharacterized protein YydD (DUF2326 family)
MVTLKKIYSETGLFDEVRFQMGINIIRGIYTRSNTEITELNGIGKSTLVRLIDYALLSDEGKIYFNTKKRTFLKEHSVTLELAIDNKTYFIRRDFENPNKAKFGISLSALEEYIVTELRVILGGLFFGKDDYKGYFENIWFRSLIKFFIKDDINHHERKNPLKFVSSHRSDYEAYVHNFFLLGLPNKSVYDYVIYKKKVDDLRKMRSKMTAHILDDTGKRIEEISSEMMQLDKKIQSFQESLNAYKFLKSYEGVEAEIINISGDISKLLSRLTPIQKTLSEYKKSYEYEVEIDSERISKMYSEIKFIFGETIKKQLDDVISFRRTLSENRRKFLAKKETELSTEIENIKAKISGFEDKRSKLYKVLDEKQALDSIKNTYQLMVEEKTKKEKLRHSIESIDKIDEELRQQNSLISEVISNIAKDINSVRQRIDAISSTFIEIIKDCIHVIDVSEAVFDIRPSPSVRSPLKISIEVPKSEALGKQQLKILAYDLTVFFNIIENGRSLPYFLVHDGVFHGIDIKTVIRILNCVNGMFMKKNNFQYIITANENETLVPEDKKDVYGQYNFNLSDTIIATYKDVPSEMIFKREY